MLHCPAGPSRTQRSAVAGCGSPGSQFWQLSRLKASPRTAGPASAPSTAEKPIHTSRLLQADGGGRGHSGGALQRHPSICPVSLGASSSFPTAAPQVRPCPSPPLSRRGKTRLRERTWQARRRQCPPPPAHGARGPAEGSLPGEASMWPKAAHTHAYSVRRLQVLHLGSKTPEHQLPKRYSSQL